MKSSMKFFGVWIMGRDPQCWFDESLRIIGLYVQASACSSIYLFDYLGHIAFH